MIVIVDYGMGNLGSIQNMFRKAKYASKISSKAADIQSATKIVLPGVGAFDSGMSNLNQLGIIPAIREKVLDEKIPLLGICLGMQLISKSSEEGTSPGLGWLDAKTVRFQNNAVKIPHMGWNTVTPNKPGPLFKDMPENPRFYFVHSYHVVCNNPQDVLTWTSHGIDFASSIQKGNMFGVQFHPEKSHKFGMKLLSNFAEIG